ncbi:P1 family peptidase [Sphingobacterium alkalisoli]|uniref:P1 family peptidase n=1 Tax=Sphingobacterium alkalisoli TaxID=1874115 RepID=A0A4U0GRD8_9SPHI|nr:P1 family peptidase [Sphingobacterium alkalisoli]TJY61515.1 P1 family peptidase [Sphingobacterium alkalisoli]GGH29907.1 D-aminopeptidase [Sphingobacterium alkalisoli]
MIKIISVTCFLCLTAASYAQQFKTEKRARDYGIEIGVMSPGKWNAITDVPGVQVGHLTRQEGDSVHTGVTAILPYKGNMFQHKVPAGIFIGNGFGKLSGISQINELGNIETPIILTNTLNVGRAIEAVVEYTLSQPGNERVQSVNAIVGETNDGELNDIRSMHVSKENVLNAIHSATSGPVQEGNVGAGTGTVCFGFKGGIGTASRVLPPSLGGYTVGVLVQTNYGGILQINGAPVGRELQQFSFRNKLLNNVDGSCMVVIATDAPLSDRNLERLAKRAFIGLGKTGGIVSNGSGEYFIAFSTHDSVRVAYDTPSSILHQPSLHNDYMSPLFMAVIEAVEEAIINSLFAAKTVKGFRATIPALPLNKVLPILKKYNALSQPN